MSTDSKTVIEFLERQSVVFGNPRRISDRGAVFTSQAFKCYCLQANIQHLLITTGVQGGNGQVERIHGIVIPMMAKLCAGTLQNWYKPVRHAQMLINSSPPRITSLSAFKLLTGVEMRLPNYSDLREILNAEVVYV